ncbi:MAG: cysteine desulfurase family protein [Candidatus Paceibacterota bacterium]
MSIDVRNLFNGKFKKKRIYLDFAAATPLDSDVFKKMEPYWSLHYGNPGALHTEGLFSKEALTDAREAIARAISVKPEEILFTSGGTEANSLAILGFTQALEERLKKEDRSYADTHFITSSSEHPSVLRCFSALESKGARVDFVDFNPHGLLDVAVIKKLLRKETVFMSCAYVNSEIGTVQPVSDIAKEIRAHEKKMGTHVVFHVDASQAPLYFDCTPGALGVDLMTIDGQKIYGPKGVGFLYKREGVSLEPIMRGGSQEFGLRPGTENIPLIVGMKESFIKAVENKDEEVKKITALRDYFIALLKKEIPQAILNGDQILRSPNNVNISIPGMDSEYLVIALDERGIAATTKSACLGRSNDAHSYVVASLYKKDEAVGDTHNTFAKSALRFSLGKGITKQDIRFVVSVLSHEVEKLDRLVL